MAGGAGVMAIFVFILYYACMRSRFEKTCGAILAKNLASLREPRDATLSSSKSTCKQTERMLFVVASLRRGRSAQSTLEPGLSANFKERKPKAKAKPPAPPANVVPHRRKPKLVKMKNLQVLVECFIDNAWHAATIKDGQISYFLPGYEYTIIYNKDKYQETRVYDKTLRRMRIPA